MRYQKSLQIEQRLAEAFRLIQTGQYSTPLLAEELGVSIPTVSRYVTALRERGYDIRAERHPDGWRYIAMVKVDEKQSARAGKNRRMAGTRSEQ